eukprot:1938290-Amphidinium_carterae.1
MFCLNFLTVLSGFVMREFLSKRDDQGKLLGHWLPEQQRFGIRVEQAGAGDHACLVPQPVHSTLRMLFAQD